jgi:hypothetical protein
VRLGYVEEDGRLREGLKRIKEFVQGLPARRDVAEKAAPLVRSVAGRLRLLAHK